MVRCCLDQVSFPLQSGPEIARTVTNFEGTGVDQFAIQAQCVEFWYTPRVDSLSAHPITKLLGTLQNQDSSARPRHASTERGTSKSTTNDHQVMSQGILLDAQRRGSAARVGGRSPPQRVRCNRWLGRPCHEAANGIRAAPCPSTTGTLCRRRRRSGACNSTCRRPRYGRKTSSRVQSLFWSRHARPSD